MKTKIVEYIGRIKDAGAETLVKDYALFMDKSKFEVVVMCEDYEPSSANYRILKENNIRVVTTYNMKLDFICRVLNRLFGSKFRSFLLKRKIRDEKPNVIHIHLEELEDFKNIASELNDVKLFYTCHNLPKRMIGNERPKERDACRYLLENKKLQIIALHEEMKSEINKMFNIDNTIVIKNGIDIERFRNVKESKNKIRESIGINIDEFLVGHIGRFMDQKNHTFLINVFYEITKLKDNAHLLLVGNGKLENDIKKQISDLGISNKVTILSKRRDIPELLKAMDIFVFPSRWEGLSVSLMEAQAAGIPCVVSNTINKESYQSDKIMELNLNEDSKNWAECCINFKCNISNYGNIENFDIKKIVNQLEELYLQ